MSLRLFPVVGDSSSGDRTALLMPPFALSIASSSYTVLCGEVTIDALLDGTMELEECP